MPRRAPRDPREPPIQFRVGTEIRQLVRAFAAQHDLPLNEAAKYLVALAVTGLDFRHFGLVRQLAEATGGANAFFRSCIHILTALEGGALATGKPLQFEPERSRFILKVVRDFLSSRGREVQTPGLWFPSEEEPLEQKEGQASTDASPRIRRKLSARTAAQYREEYLERQQEEGERQEERPPPESDRPKQRGRT